MMEAPPTWERLLLEQPWPLVLGLLVLAVVLAVLGVYRRHRSLLVASVVGLLLATGVWMLARAVTTPRESVVLSTRALLDATYPPPDTRALQQLIDPGVQLLGPGGQPWLTGDAVRQAVEAAAKRHPFDSHTVQSLQAGVDAQGIGTVELTLRTWPASGGLTVPTRSQWRLRWEPGEAEGEPWRLIEVRWLEIFNQSPSRGLIP